MTTDAGYSGTPLYRKLGVKPEHRVLVWAAPEAWGDDGVVQRVDPLRSANVEIVAADASPPATGRPPYDVVVSFCRDLARMQATVGIAMARTTTPGRVWVAWPKRASGVPTDLIEDDVRAAALAVGWVDVKVCAIDAVWSGLCLVRRKENR